MADNQKKVTDLTGITTPADANLIPIHDGTGLKNITFANFRNKVNEPMDAKVEPLLFNNAAAHNAIYRGKNIVVAGDSKQLRPSTAFMKRYLGGDTDTDDVSV